MTKICVDCGNAHGRRSSAQRCLPCRDRHLLSIDPTGGIRASRLLNAAVKGGLIDPVLGLACVDCGGFAVDYDHRDYNYPLRVEPVCRMCNNHRGRALPFRQLRPGWFRRKT